MKKDKDNIYYGARMRAAAADPLFASRERVAAEIYVSQEALHDYETGRTVPPCDAVQKMVEAYGAPELRGQHIRACCPLIADYGTEGEGGLQQAALGMTLALCGCHENKDIVLRFARVARDGRISREELQEAQALRQTADDIRRAMEEAVTAIDRGLARLREG